MASLTFFLEVPGDFGAEVFWEEGLAPINSPTHKKQITQKSLPDFEENRDSNVALLMYGSRFLFLP